MAFVCGVVVLLGYAVWGAVAPVVPPSAGPFSAADVRLLDGPFKLSRDAAARYLLSLDMDRLLAPYLTESGLKPKAPAYPGWETTVLPGVGLGFYLSGMSYLAAGTGDKEFTRRVNYILDELESCQQATGGYLLGTRNGRAIFARIEKEGKFKGFAPWSDGCAEPYYALEKIFSGLRDAYRIAGLTRALQIEIRLGDWLSGHMSHLSDAWLADLMVEEFGGMNWVLSDLYADTGDARFMALSRRWQDQKVLAGPAAGMDNLSGKHANTQIPKFSGLAARYPFSGDPADLKTAAFFWESVVRHHSYADGGNSEREHFSPADKLNDLLSQSTGENCNEYNLLRLTQLLFNIQPRAEYAAYMERVLFNHILAAQDVRDSRICYFLPLKSGASRAPESLYDDFSCCVCSGFDSYSRNAAYIYSHGSNELYVNLFVASELVWKDKHLVLRQETKFPDDGSASFHLSLREPARFSFYIRNPLWSAGGFEVHVNAVAQKITAAPGEWVRVEREWRDGDKIMVKMPLALHTESMPDNPNRVAMFAGPILLAGDLGPAIDPTSEDPEYVPLLVPGEKRASEWLQPTGRPLTFQTTVARPRQIELQPLFRLQDRSYAVYWDRVTSAGWDAHLKEVRQQRERIHQLDARTFDKVTVGDSASETAHRLEGGADSLTGRGNRGLAMHLCWRQARAKTIAYWMKVPPDTPATIRCRYVTDAADEDEGPADFEIQVGGTTIARESPKPKWRPPPDARTVEYPIPFELTRGKDQIQIVFRPASRKRTANLTEVRVLTEGRKGL